MMSEANWMEIVYVLITRSVDITGVSCNMKPIKGPYTTRVGPK